MEINKKNIHMSHRVGKAEHIITIDDDFIVPDVKPDIERKIKETADVIVEKVKQVEDRVSVSGSLNYHFLYSSGTKCCSMEGKVPFDELVVMPEITAQDMIRCTCMLQDISVTVINSRKISVRAVISLEVLAERIFDREAVTGLQEEDMQLMKSRFNPLQLCISKKDIFRIRESVNLPSDRRNIGAIEWYEINPEGLDIRMCDGYISIKGDLSVMCIYTPEDDPEGMNFYSQIIPFSGKTEIDGCEEDMYPDISVSVFEKSLISRPDANGEMRIIDAELILDLDVNGYKEETFELLSDAYSPLYNLKCIEEEVNYETFVIRNSVKCRADDKFAINSDEPILQLMNSTGKVNIDDMLCNDNGIIIEGSVTLDIMYLQADDKIGFIRHEIPFSHEAEIQGIGKNCIYNTEIGSLEINTGVVSGNEIDAKCNAILNVFAKEMETVKIITDIKADPPDMEYYKNLPGITGYITKTGDTLWNIAKKYCTTIKNIETVNELTSEDILPGTRLIILKTTQK